MQPTNHPLSRPTPPYDTGKVKIGLCYTPGPNWSVSRDSFDLQTALLPRAAVRPSLSDRLVSFFRSFV